MLIFQKGKLKWIDNKEIMEIVEKYTKKYNTPEEFIKENEISYYSFASILKKGAKLMEEINNEKV